MLRPAVQIQTNCENSNYRGTNGRTSLGMRLESTNRQAPRSKVSSKRKLGGEKFRPFWTEPGDLRFAGTLRVRGCDSWQRRQLLCFAKTGVR